MSDSESGINRQRFNLKQLLPLPNTCGLLLLRYKLLQVRTTKELFFGLFFTNYGETFIILISVFPHRHINLLYSERIVRLCMFIACLVKFHHGIIANTYVVFINTFITYVFYHMHVYLYVRCLFTGHYFPFLGSMSDDGKFKRCIFIYS